MTQKNITEINLDHDFCCIQISNSKMKNISFEKLADKSIIQFHFSLQGDTTCFFNNRNYSRDISEGKYQILYNPKQDLNIDIESKKGSFFICILISINRFHKLFYQDLDKISYLNIKDSVNKYYHEEEISDEIKLALNEITKYETNSTKTNLYLKAKIYEIISLIFLKESKTNLEECPFLASDETVRKIKLAKDIMIEEFASPPTLIELSDRIKLSLKKLKEGFKRIYGQPIYRYLLEYKMQRAKRMLLEDKYNVNEISMMFGYSNASHFIASFKKRFGITPKSFVKNYYK